MTTNANMGGLLGPQAPGTGTTPWWTDAQAQGTATGPYGNPNTNAGGAGQDFTQVQNVPTADMSVNPQYLSALQQMGYTGGMPQSPSDYQALNQFLQQNGLQSQTSYDNGGTQTSQLAGPNGQPVAGTNRTYGSDPGDQAFLDAIIGGATFGIGTAAGIGVDAATAGGDAAAGGGGAAGSGLAGTDLPAYSAYGGAGSGASAPLAGDATGTGILSGEGATGAGVSGTGLTSAQMGLAEGVYPTSVASGGGIAGLQGLSGTSLLQGIGTLVGNGVSSAGDWAVNHPGTALKVAGLGAGLLGDLTSRGGSSGAAAPGSAQYVPKPAVPFTSHVTPQYQPVQQQTGLLSAPQGQANSGLWRYMSPPSAAPLQGLLGQKTIMPVNPNSPGAQ